MCLGNWCLTYDKIWKHYPNNASHSLECALFYLQMIFIRVEQCEFHLANCTRIEFRMLLWLKWHNFNAYFCKFVELWPYTHQKAHAHCIHRHTAMHRTATKFTGAHLHQMDFDGSFTFQISICCLHKSIFHVSHFFSVPNITTKLWCTFVLRTIFPALTCSIRFHSAHTFAKL